MRSRHNQEAWVVRLEPPTFKEERSKPMTFENPEIVELGLAEELVRDDDSLESTEAVMRVKVFSATYVADAE